MKLNFSAVYVFMSQGSLLKGRAGVAAAAVATGTLLFVGGAAFHWFAKWRKENNCSDFASEVTPECAAQYLTAREYAVFVAMCDAFFPSLSEDEVRRQTALTSATVTAIPGRLASGAVPMYYDPRGEDPMFIDKNMDILRVGALERGVHIEALQRLTDSTNDEERAQVSMLLRLLSTTAGCLVITGLPAPFHELALGNRVRALRSLRDSFLGDLRVGYQVSCTYIRALMLIVWKLNVDICYFILILDLQADHNDVSTVKIL
jgi:hypothetical protein